MNIKILTSATVCATIVGTTYFLLFSDSKNLSQEAFMKEANPKVSISSNEPSQNLIPLSILESSQHGPDCAHCVAQKEPQKLESFSAPKPVEHDRLPAIFDTALISESKDGEDFRYIATSSGMFSEMQEFDIGDAVIIEFAEGLFVEGIIKSLKDYQSADSTIAGMIELSEYDAKLSFFTTPEKTTAQILFNEKSKALVYQENATEWAFVEKSVSELFCTYDPQAVYPINHPSNQ